MRFDKWDITGFDRDVAARLCTGDNNGKHNNHLLYVLLASRGKTCLDDVKSFLDAKSMPLHDPYLLADMDKAVRRIRKAIDDKEKIAIYGDYDVDGMTSSAMLARWLKANGAQFEIYIPGRYDEGYGLNTAALDTLKERGATLVVTVDCGITATEEAQHAKNIGLELIITDHHECKGTLPEAVAVVDPKRRGCDYPFKSLAGVGVVFKLICALEGRNLSPDLLSTYSHLAALGTVADVMPIDGENRALVTHGLEILNSNPGVGIKKLIAEVCSAEDRITAETISYALAPRLNAAGRMADPLLSVNLLLSDDEQEAERCVSELCRLNTERRALEQDILDSALAQIEGREISGPVVLSGEGWHQGVIGIVASKLSDRFSLPVVIISIDKDGIGHGSCRSRDPFSIYDALYGVKDTLIEFGGHKTAAGITIAAKDINKLKKSLAQYYKENTAQAAAPGLNVDFEATMPEKLLTLEKIEALSRLEPFDSHDNHPPCLCITGATLSAVTSVGTGKHSKLIIEKDESMFDCIFFSAKPDDLGVSAGDTVDIAFEPQINEFRGRRRVQLNLADIRKTVA